MGTYIMVVLLFTYYASAGSPPRLTDTGARFVTNTILTRWNTNSRIKNPTDGNMSNLCIGFHEFLQTLTSVRARSSHEEKGGPRGNDC